jgi:hypothetical protein
MEPEGSLPHSQVPAICLYPDPAQSNLYPKSHFLKIQINIIIPSKSVLSQWFLSLRRLHKKPVHISPLPRKCYIPCPLLSFRFYHPHNSRRRVQIMELLIMYFSPLPCSLVPLRPKYSPQHPILKHPPPQFLPQCPRPSFTPIQNAVESTVYKIKMFHLKFIQVLRL